MNNNEPATKRQLWALFCATKKDYRDAGLTRKQASELLSNLNTGRIQWTKHKILDVIHEARNVGMVAANKKLAELEHVGPRWAVCETDIATDKPTKVVGTMLDVCGNATLRILARGKFYLLARKLCEEDRSYRFHCQRGYYGGGRLSIFDSTGRQEMSVNEASYQAMAEVLKKYGIEATVETRID